MTDDTFRLGGPERFARAIVEPTRPRVVVDAIAGEPDRLEAGWLLLGRDVELGDGHRVDLLALDSERRLVVVCVEDGSPALGLADALECHRRVELQAPLLGQVISSIARPGIGPIAKTTPRLVFLTGRDTRYLETLVEVGGAPPIEAFRYRLFRVGDRQALHLDANPHRTSPGETSRPNGEYHATPDPAPETGPPRPGAVAGPEPSASRRERLLADARTRILNLSADITTLEADEGLTFRYRGTELARFATHEDGLRVTSPSHPAGRVVLGRSDLEEALHGVIESFFALYTHGASKKPDAASIPANEPAPELGSRSAPADATSEIFESMGREPSIRPMPGPLPLTPEELDAFLEEDEPLP